MNTIFLGNDDQKNLVGSKLTKFGSLCKKISKFISKLETKQYSRKYRYRISNRFVTILTTNVNVHITTDPIVWISRSYASLDSPEPSSFSGRDSRP